MKKRVVRAIVLALGVMLPLFGGAVRAAEGLSAPSTLLDLEQAWLKATESRDTATLNRILSDDYVDINYKGIVRHKTDALKTSNVSSGASTQTLSDENVRTYGNTAVVTGRGMLSAGDHTYHWRFTDVFVVSSGRWQAVSSEETAESGD